FPSPLLFRSFAQQDLDVVGFALLRIVNPACVPRSVRLLLKAADDLQTANGALPPARIRVESIRQRLAGFRIRLLEPDDTAAEHFAAGCDFDCALSGIVEPDANGTWRRWRRSVCAGYLSSGSVKCGRYERQCSDEGKGNASCPGSGFWSGHRLDASAQTIGPHQQLHATVIQNLIISKAGFPP